MKIEGITEPVDRLKKFRESIYCSFKYRADAMMDLIDAISSNDSANSVAELSLNPLFTRQYSSLFDAVDNFFVPNDLNLALNERLALQRIRMRTVASFCPDPVHRPFYLFGLDTTSIPHPFADTLKDRGVVYNPNPAPGNKPIVSGHSYSVVAALPEKQDSTSPPWILPLLVQRVPSDKKSCTVGSAQIADLLTEKDLPFNGKLCAAVGDSVYSGRDFIGQVVVHNNLVTIVRIRGNRKLYHAAPEMDTPAEKGHPQWYGSPFDLKDSSTLGDPNDSTAFPYTMKNGRECHVEGKAWHNILMTGKRDIPMHQHPFTAVCFTVKDSKGKAVFQRPLWLIILGNRRDEISLSDAYESYRQRYDLEHFFRFGKNRLLMSEFQSPEIEHQDNWMELVLLAYAQLYIAAPLAKNLPRPWERYLPQYKKDNMGLVSPSMVQRNMHRIIQEVGTPSGPVKKRGISPGRSKNFSPEKREKHPVKIKSAAKKQVVRAP